MKKQPAKPAYKVHFHEDETRVSFLEIGFNSRDLTSQQVEDVLREELEKHKHRGTKDIHAEAAWINEPVGEDEDFTPFPLPDHSIFMIYSKKLKKILTASQAYGRDADTKETRNYFYRITTEYWFGGREQGTNSHIDVVFKNPASAKVDNVYQTLIKIGGEWTLLENPIILNAFEGNPKDPMSWRPICDGGKHLRVVYNPRTRAFLRSDGKVLKTLRK